MSDTSPSIEEVLFELALQMPSTAERAAFLDGVCHENPSLRIRLEKLLATHFAAEGFLPNPTKSKPAYAVRLGPASSGDPSPRIGNFRLLEKIGEGGFGEVWMADQIEPVRRRVALKIVRLGMDSRQVVARFEAERQALALMDHANIARIFDAGTTDTGRPYFVMELVRGTSITDYCDQNRLSTTDRLRLFTLVCHAIQHAHQKAIIHRDIKPSNILVTLHDGVPVPKVIDFGIAKAMQQELTEKTVFTQFSQFIGTPAYISPEQAETSGLDIDTRADIYSLGVLLYELLVGRTPFDAKEMAKGGIDALRQIIRQKEPTTPSKRLKTLPAEDRTTTAQRRRTDAVKLIHLLRGDLDWIVMKCLEKDRARRYETANGLAMDIQRYLSHEPIVARPPGTAYKFYKAWQRNRLLFSALAAVALALSAGLSVSTWQAVVATRARRAARAAQTAAEQENLRAVTEARRAVANELRARRLLYAADMNLAQQALKLNNVGKARRLLDRHRPQASEDDLRGWEWRYLWQLTRGSDRVTLDNRPTSGDSVSISPDGRYLAVGWRDGLVDLWDVAAREKVRELTNHKSAQGGQVAFAPSGNLLVATAGLGVVMKYDMDAGTESLLWKLPNADARTITNLAFSSDGSRLSVYYTRGENSDEVWVVNVASTTVEGRYESLTTGKRPFFFGEAQLSHDNQRLFLSRNDPSNRRCQVQCLDLVTGRELWQSQGARDAGITALDLSPDGRLLAIGSGFADPAIRICDASTGMLLATLEGHTSWVSELVFTADGRSLISASADSQILVWNPETWAEPKRLSGHADEIHALAISKSGQLVATAGKDGSLILWNPQASDSNDGHRLLPGDLRPDQVLPVDHSRLLLLRPNIPPSLIDLKKFSAARSVDGIQSAGEVLGWFPPNLLCHWNGTNQILVSELNGGDLTPLESVVLASNTRPSDVAYHVQRQLLAWTEASAPTSMWMAKLGTSGRRRELKNDAPFLAPFKFSEDGRYLACRCRGEWPLRVWDVESGRIVASADGDIADAVFAAGGQILVVARKRMAIDHEFAFYDLGHPDQSPRRLPGRYLPRALSVSPDGSLVAASTHDGRVRFLDPRKAEVIDEVRGQNGAFGVAYSADGQRLISCSVGPESIKLWDANTRQELLTFSGITEANVQPRWSADGDTFLTGTPWQVWHAPSWDEIEAAEARDKPTSK